MKNSITPQIFGILNITPDSFSDGGIYNHIESAISRTEEMIASGAKIIDIGAESTRPGAVALTAEEEWQRLGPVLPAVILVAAQHEAEVSLDSYHSANILQALDMGVDIINDISGHSDEQVIKAIARSNKKLVITDNAIGKEAGKDPVLTCIDRLSKTIWRATALGLAPQQIIIDPAIGFGKNAEESLELIGRCAELVNFARKAGVSLLFGHSRKSCFASIAGEKDSTKRDPETIAASIILAQSGVDYLRLHNVEANLRAIQAFSALSAYQQL